ncbi:MAG: aldo/keto reductase, partial [Gemmatimonadetes bacterium]|nr:aldo/keto reductase [Gemmatimonadota bacterium]
VPGTAETLPIVGLGSSKPVLEIPTAGTEPLAAVIRVLLEHGGRVVDTSPRTPEIDAEFSGVLTAPEFRDRLFVTMKINTNGEAAGVQQMRQNQMLVGRRTLDLLQVESLRDLDVHWPNVLRWKDEGEARYIGVTVSDNRQHDRFEAVMRSEPIDFVQINYSVMEPQAEDRLLPLAQDLGMAVLINRPFMNGSYFGRVSGRTLPGWVSEFDCSTWAQFSLKYILAHPAVTCALTETTNPDHMEDNIGAAFGRLPDEAMKRRMREYVLDF